MFGVASLLQLYEVQQQVVDPPVPGQVEGQRAEVPGALQSVVQSGGVQVVVGGAGDADVVRVIRLKLDTGTVQD